LSWKNIEKNKTWQAMQRVRELTQLVIDGKKALQMFCSVPGLGKSETVLEVLAQNKIKPHYSSPDSIQGFCADLWRNKDTVYFLDDCDILAREEKLVNIAKMAYGPQRIVVVPSNLRIQRNEDWRISDDDRYDPDVPPPTFNLGGKHGLIWCSNKNFTDPAVIRANMKGDFAALVSRGLDPVWIPSDPQSVLDYTIWMILDGMLRRHPQQDHGNRRGGFKLEVQQAVLDFMCNNARRLTEISPRMAWKLAMARRDDPHYEDAWKQQLSPHVRYPALILPDMPPRLTARSGKTVSPVIPQTPEPPQQPDETPVDPEPLKRPAILLHNRRNGTDRDVVMTPRWFAKEIIDYFPLEGFVLDPSKGEGAFYDQFPAHVQKDWCEVRENRDFFDWQRRVDWILGNTPWSGYAFTAFQEHSFELADNVALLIPSAMGLTTKKRIRLMAQFGHALKEIVFYDWPPEWPQYAFTLTVHHWQRGWTGEIKMTNMMTDRKLVA
jgi:hypothetical protein